MIERRSFAARASDSSVTCARSFATCAGVALAAICRISHGSISRRASNTSRASATVGLETNAPRLWKTVTIPSCASRAIACRILVRLTPNTAASFSSTSCVPGSRRRSLIAVTMRSWIWTTERGFGRFPPRARTPIGRSAPPACVRKVLVDIVNRPSGLATVHHGNFVQ